MKAQVRKCIERVFLFEGVIIVSARNRLFGVEPFIDQRCHSGSIHGPVAVTSASSNPGTIDRIVRAMRSGADDESSGSL